MAHVTVYEARTMLRRDSDNSTVRVIEGLLVITTSEGYARATAIFGHRHATLEDEVASMHDLLYLAENAARNAATPAAGAHAAEVVMEYELPENVYA